MNNPTRKIFVMRHADPENKTGTMYGNLPGFHLGDKGKEQSKEASDFLRRYPLDIIIVSNLERAQETGEIIAETDPNHPQIIIDQRTHDVGIEPVQGKITLSEWKANRDEIMQNRLDGKDGFERPIDCQKRIVEAFWDNVRKYPDKNILFVSHGDPIWFLSLEFMEKEFDLTKPYPDTHSWFPDKAEIREVVLEPEVKIIKIFQPTLK